MDEIVYPVMDDILCTTFMYRNAHGNDVIKYENAHCCAHCAHCLNNM